MDRLDHALQALRITGDLVEQLLKLIIEQDKDIDYLRKHHDALQEELNKTRTP